MPELAPDIEMASLEVTTHLDAEIFLIGNDRQLVARAVGKLRTKQPKGLYRVKVTRASAAVEQLLELDGDRTIPIVVPGLDGIVPFQRTTDPQALAEINALAAGSHGNSGTASFLLIGRMPLTARGWKGAPPASDSEALLSPVRFNLWNAAGAAAPEAAKAQEKDIGNERWAVAGKTLQPGIYILEVQDGIRVTRQAVVVAPNRQTRVFVRRQPAPAVPAAEQSKKPDLIEVAVHMSRGWMPIALEPVYESSEIARRALAMGSRIVVSREILDIFLDEKFTDPAAGIAAAHLMFDALEHAQSGTSRKNVRGDAPKSSRALAPTISIGPALVHEVVTNLLNLLQMPQGILPDLVALKLRAKVPLTSREKTISEPPIYARSWETLIAASTGAKPQIKISADMFGQCAANFTSGAYFAWSPTSIAEYVEHLIAGNESSLQLAEAVASANAAPSLSTRDQVSTNVRKHLADVFATKPSQLRQATNLKEKFQINQRGLQKLAAGINSTDWMKQLPFDLKASDMKGLNTIGDITEIILNKALASDTSEAPDATLPVRERATSAAAALRSVIADVKSRLKLADQIGIPRSVFDELITASRSDASDASEAAPAASTQRHESSIAQLRRPLDSQPRPSEAQMSYVVKDEVTTRLREEPLATAKSKKTLFQGTLLGDPVKASDGFLFFELGPPGDAALKGWILKEDCEEVPHANRLPVNEAGFVQECVNVQLLFNEETKPVDGAPPIASLRPWVVSADFLIARALYETDIQNFGKNIPGSDGVGPLQVTLAEWKDFTDNGGILASDARASDREHPVLQIPGAAYRQHVHGKAMSKIFLDAGKATAEDPFVPSFLDMFLAHVTNSPAAALAIREAQDAGTPPDTSIKEVLKAVMTAEELSALFKAREKLSGLPTVFFGTEASPSTLKAVVDIAEDTLKKLLVAALTRIEKHRPDMIPEVTAGGAPWMAIAEQAEVEGVKEGTHNAVISKYLADTDFGGKPDTNPLPAWCGAFAAHCMKRCDSPTIQASVPKGAAAAVSWKSWGADFPLQSKTIPRGAVIVLSPTAETSGTGHVGFFLEFSPDKKKVFLLGGNQSKKVGKTPFLASQIAAVRWLDQPGAVGAVEIDGLKLPPGVAPANRQFAGLILKAFAAAGFGRDQQIAALANAIGESNLNPRAHNTNGEDSVGLFQLNRVVGVGGHHSVESLMDPAFNTQLIIAEAKRFPSFAKAANLREAVDVFVRSVERPADKAGQSAKRFKIAQDLIA
ncbi:hypothetical protein JQ597_20540 [Bradyrhizobium sp. AUGA SZCCT0177]|uniref:hypothetical protein n=1 Tax=Bradyrhizobium sp. AUGA SZCCT0177 TaxID=2807665 RepID=UPI001BAE3D1F|nr:hypothetical protein [Bradyrhizobium sp. AUGA SZCCT0177]MBR1284441.1 hypothetical protein [Bradyrhizobium sp. AUGA SZCCT0177]